MRELTNSCLLNIFKLNKEIVRQQISVDGVRRESAQNQSVKSAIKVEYFEEAEYVPDPSDLNKSDKNILIFDDLILSEQDTIEAYHTRGRHSNVDCIYLCQNYFKLPRQTIRENANLFVLFKQDLKNLNHIYNDHVTDDMDREEFRNFCKQSWKSLYSFVTIDLNSRPE